MVLDPFIVFNWLHRAAGGENCKKDVNQVAWKGYIEGLIAWLESPYQLRHVLVSASSIILIFQICLFSYQEQQKLYKSTSNQINMSHFGSPAHCWEDPNSSHIQYSEHLKSSSPWFRIRNILKDWDPKHVQRAGAGDGCCGPGPDRAGSMSSPFSSFSSSYNKARPSAWRESASRYSALREILSYLSFFLSSI